MRTAARPETLSGSRPSRRRGQSAADRDRRPDARRLVFLVSLPPILWAAAYFTSLHDFRVTSCRSPCSPCRARHRRALPVGHSPHRRRLRGDWRRPGGPLRCLGGRRARARLGGARLRDLHSPALQRRGGASNTPTGARRVGPDDLRADRHGGAHAAGAALRRAVGRSGVGGAAAAGLRGTPSYPGPGSGRRAVLHCWPPPRRSTIVALPSPAPQPTL